MDFIPTSGSGSGSYEKPKPGSYIGVLIGFADLGTHDGQFGQKRRIMLRWELHKRKGPSLDTEGKILTITAMYNQSFNDRSSLRKVVEAHIGKTTDGVLIRSHDWLGKSARLTVKESDDGKYVNVDTVVELDAEDDLPPHQVEKAEHWEIGDQTPCPGWCKWMVERSLEWKRVHGEATGTPAKVLVTAHGEEEDPDVPF